jgi:hypothetical protein
MTTRKRPRRSGEHPFSFTNPEQRAFIPVADLLLPDVSLNEGQRVFLVREGFMEALVHDPRVLRFFESWIAAARAGAPFDDPTSFVADELGLRWPWCTVGLMETFHRMVLLVKDFDPAKALPPPGEAVVLAPPIKLTFRTKDGESVQSARFRLLSLVVDALVLFDETEKPVDGADRAPRKDTEYLRTWGRWFYEARVRKPPTTIMAIATEHHAASRHPGKFEDHDCRKQVREGIAEAEHLLSRGAYVISGLPGD